MQNKCFTSGKTAVPDIKKYDGYLNQSGIYKYHQVAHQRFAWYIKTNPKVQEIFKRIWDTDNLIVSFDGSCYIPKECESEDKYWTHVDQSPMKIGLHCYQGLVALTSNKERTLVVYEGSHKLYERYCQLYNVNHNNDWEIINYDVARQLESRKRVLNVSAGSLVIWDSRTFHQNQFGMPNSEERIVQYVCYLPRSVMSNNDTMRIKRIEYFKKRRTTTHWPSPITLVSEQPMFHGYDIEIDYSKLPAIYLDDLKDKIEELL